MGTINPLKLYSDHSNLLYFKTAKYLSPEQAQWASFLDMFNMLIFHIQGVKNPADAPSQREDFLPGDRLQSDATKLVEKLAVTANDGMEKSHDIFFQYPNKELSDYFKRSYLPTDRKEKGVLISC
jgi:hypothetical protein